MIIFWVYINNINMFLIQCLRLYQISSCHWFAFIPKICIIDKHSTCHIDRFWIMLKCFASLLEKQFICTAQGFGKITKTFMNKFTIEMITLKWNWLIYSSIYGTKEMSIIIEYQGYSLYLDSHIANCTWVQQKSVIGAFVLQQS